MQWSIHHCSPYLFLIIEVVELKMAGMKWLILLAVVAVVFQMMLVKGATIDSEVDEREADDEEMARAIVERLAMLSDSDETNEEKMEARSLQKRGWFRRAVRRVGRWIRRNPIKTVAVVGKLAGKK